LGIPNLSQHQRTLVLRQSEFKWGDFSLQVLRQINDKELSQGLDHHPQAA
jgi:hypothetical protein